MSQVKEIDTKLAPGKERYGCFDRESVTGEFRPMRLGAYALLLYGALYVILLVYVVLTPPAQRYGTADFLQYFGADRIPLTVAWVMIVFTSTLGFTLIVPSVWEYLFRSIRGRNSCELFRAVTIYGAAGYAFLAVGFFTLMAKAPGLARAYASGDQATKNALNAVGLPELDPNGWIVFGGIATWVIVSSYLAYRSKKMSLLHAGFGLLFGIGFWSTVIADAITYEPLNKFAAGISAITAPVWAIWLGRNILRETTAHHER